MRQYHITVEELNDCPRLTRRVCEEHNIAPNEMFFMQMKAVLVAKRSASGDDFSISVGGLKYCIDQENKTPGVQAYVLLIDRDGSRVAQTTARELTRKLNGTMPRSGDSGLGPYWWIDTNFDNASQRSLLVNQPPWLAA